MLLIRLTRSDLQSRNEARTERESGSSRAAVCSSRRPHWHSSDLSAESSESSAVFCRQEHRSFRPAPSAAGDWLL